MVEQNGKTGSKTSPKTPSRLDLAVVIGKRAYEDAKLWGWSEQEASEWQDLWAGGVLVHREQTFGAS
jgi:hypothetical protein